VIDIHCHILPCLDDGSKSWDITLEMCRIAVADGIKHIVATPHANEQYSYNRNEVRERIIELDRQVGAQLQFSIGCDFHLSYDNIEDAIAHPQKYTIAAKQYLLVELSDFFVPSQMSEVFFRLMTAGMIPIITHPERNPNLQRQPEPIFDWVKAGCLVQLTASSLTGRWGAEARSVSMLLLKENAVHVLATDAHDTKHRPPVLSEAREFIARGFGQLLAQALVEENPEAIINGRPLSSIADLSETQRMA
jgi:protein-tyrosine phosphatase